MANTNSNTPAPVTKSDTAPVKYDDLSELATMLGLRFQSTLGECQPPRELILGDFNRLLGSWGKQFKVVPLGITEEELIVATSDPLNIEALDSIQHCYGKPLQIIVAPEQEVMRAINSVRTSLMSDRSQSLEPSQKAQESEDMSGSLKIDVTDAEDDDAPIIRYVNALIFRAANERASDIHVEPYEDKLKVRFRIDGVLNDVDEEDKSYQAAILSRIKVMASLDIAEKRLPQDGRIGIKIAGKDVDIRVSTVPTRFGERIVMRLLDKANVMIDIASLGLSADYDAIVKKLIVKSHGIVLVTGPTGSGKTTTLYACLSAINSPDKNILTVEDPVEYELPGIGQMQVNPKINFTFASGLRSILRQDPDVIMVGEIRDLETAEIAVQASLTGHLVFSTLHTNDAPGAIARLNDMGVEPFLIASSLLGVVAQRLLRTLCPHCKTPTEVTDLQCKELGVDPKTLKSRKIYTISATGCKECQYTGYKGRTGIHELLLIDDTVRGEIMKRSDSSRIRQACKDMASLRLDGAKKILAGITSIEEVVRVTQEDALDF
ncbi:MAG: type II secretion system ATPase GspE [Deltaproteobacteria bacterium]|nr:type II secretion system ATPase GspE [Deltaproteobacteria bacterium]